MKEPRVYRPSGQWRRSATFVLFLTASIACRPTETETEEASLDAASRSGGDETDEPVPPGELSIIEPEDGSRVVGDMLTLRGSSSSLSMLQVGEIEIDIAEDGSWFAEIEADPGLQRIEFIATTQRGPIIDRERLVLFGAGRSVSEPVTNGAILHLSPEQIRRLGAQLASEIDPDEVETSMQESGPLHRSALGPAVISVVIDRLEFEETTVVLEPGDGVLDLEMHLDRLEVDTNIEIRIGPLGHTARLSMHADPAVIHTTMLPTIVDEHVPNHTPQTTYHRQY